MAAPSAQHALLISIPAMSSPVVARSAMPDHSALRARNGFMGCRGRPIGLGPLALGHSPLSKTSQRAPVARPFFSENTRRVTVCGNGNTFGNVFRVTTFGESHGGGVGCVIDGCPPRLEISEADMQVELDRRRPGQSRITTPRDETDTCTILSGIADGVTTGTPIAVLVMNKNTRGQDYSDMAIKYRPSHADATYDFKYGVRSVQGGGRSSARETIGRVAAGAVAKKILRQVAGCEVLAFVSSVRDVDAENVNLATFTMDDVESNIVRCPDAAAAERMIAAIDEVRVRGDSCGGVVTCVARGVPRGLGAPVFDKLEADLAKAIMSLPATKGFEIGSGFAGARMTGSQHNDEFFRDESGTIRTRTNRSGGIQGGISNGEDIVIRIAFKPTSTITTPQRTVTRDGQETELRARGRHDPCVVPRAVPMVEAMVALVLVDHLMQHHAQCNLLDLAMSAMTMGQISLPNGRMRAPSAKEEAEMYGES